MSIFIGTVGKGLLLTPKWVFKVQKFCSVLKSPSNLMLQMYLRIMLYLLLKSKLSHVTIILA